MVTQRDQIWKVVLDLIEYHRSINVRMVRDKLGSDPPAKRTIRNTLSSMEDLGLLISKGGTGSAPKEFSPVAPGVKHQRVGYSSRDTTQSSILPYPGGKSGLADWITSHMPTHDTYVEVFGGGAGVLFNKPKSKYEVYNDLDDDLTNFFAVLRNHPEELATWLQAVPYSRSQYEDWVYAFYNGERPTDRIERAGQFFAIRYMQFAGISSTANGFKSRARRSPARSFDNARNRINAMADRFAQVTIENQPFGDIFAQYDDSTVDVLFYADPPYFGSEDQYTVGFDRNKFVSQLLTVDADWMVSCIEVPLELQEYTVIEREERHRMSRTSNTVCEKLVVNFDLDDCGRFVDSYTAK